MKLMYRIYGIIVVILLAGVVVSCNSGGSTKPVPCDGVVSAGYCWYLGALGQSCDQACTNHGGCNTNGITYAGSQGAAAACDDVLTALDADTDTLGDGTDEENLTNTPAIATGCSIDYLVDNIDRNVYWPGNCGAAFPKTRRACACNQ
jgi:hypothetical protein